jgi:GTP-binding protein
LNDILRGIIVEVSNVKLEAVAVKKAQYPEDNKPEIAFVGKSNVGKSSLINVLVNRKALARTSQNPGKTRTINFYLVEDLLYFVDLPGYGYAKAPKNESIKWGSMIESYLLKRPQLKTIILLIDVRHEPSNNDKAMFEWLNHYHYHTIIVLTKSDKLTRNQLQKNISLIRKSLALDKDYTLLPFSSQTKAGKQELWQIIEDLIE